MAIRSAGIVLALYLASTCAMAAESRFPELESLGKALYEEDRAAWLASDRLTDEGPLPSGLVGWVTLPFEKGRRVHFVQEEANAFCSRFSVLVDENGASPLRRTETCEPLTSEQRAMFLARQTALSSLQASCSETYNTVVLPHEGADAAWAVYLLAATKEPGTTVVGGHVRVLVGTGGLEVANYQPLSNGCLTLEARSSDGKPAAVIVTHVLHEHPIETHVFLSLLHGLPLYVMTKSAMWAVTEGKIRLLMDGEDFKAYLAKAKDVSAEDRSAESPTDR